MKTTLAVTWKELLDLFRDRRTVAIGLLMGPILFPVLILGMGAVVEQRVTSQLEKTLDLPVLGAERAPNLVAWLEGQNIAVRPPGEDVEAAIRAQDVDVALKIHEDYAEDWRAGRPALVEILYDASRQDSQIPVQRVEGLLRAYGQSVGSMRLLARGISPSVGQPVLVARRDLSTPEARMGQLLAFLPYLLILSAFLGGAYLVIDVTAGERERQSLEPLLATPAAREAIMSGKILAACSFGLLSLVLTLAAFKIAFFFAPGFGGKLDVSLFAIVKILAVLVPMLLIGTTLLTLISASVKSVKEAQSYMSILMLAPLIPTIFLMVNPVKNQLWMFAVPFLAQNQMIMKILRQETSTALEWATYFGAGLGLGFLLWLVAARLYHREKLAISG